MSCSAIGFLAPRRSWSPRRRPARSPRCSCRAMNRSPVPTGWSAGMQNTTTSTSDRVSRTTSLSRWPSRLFGLCSPGVSTSTSCAVRPVHDAADRVPGGLRPVADDADLLADQRVGQRRLAGVRAAHEAGEAAAVRRLVGLGLWSLSRQSPTGHRPPHRTARYPRGPAMILRMAGRSRREQGEPLAVRAAREADRAPHAGHLLRVSSARAGRSGRSPSRPAPLRYWQYDAVRSYVVALVALAAGGVAGLPRGARRGGRGARRDPARRRPGR